MPEITLTFEGPFREAHGLPFKLFDGMLRTGEQKEVPGGARIAMKPALEQRSSPFAHAAVEIGLFVGKNVAVPLFVSWLYDKWKESGAKSISVKIENHFYEFDPVLLTKAIEEAVKRREEKRKAG